jgi:protein ImuB
MYASLHTDAPQTEFLLEVSQRFSPEVELSGNGQTATFCITPLRKMIGSPHQIASEICRAGHEFKLQASLAIAANPDAAILLARNFIGVTMVTPGEERSKLASIPLAEIFAYDPVRLEPSMLEILLRWGVKTAEDLVALPERGVSERLGQAGIYLRNLAAGKLTRPLRLNGGTTNYEIQMELEHSLTLLEPLLFLLSRAISELCQRMRSQSRAARELEVHFDLESRTEESTEKNKAYACHLEFPIPLDDPRTILKLLQLHLERHSPGAPICAFKLGVIPVEPKRVQGGIFLPPAPAADKLQVTMARIANMVGASNVGTPALLNTHRPDAFNTTLLPGQAKSHTAFSLKDESRKPEMLRLAMRLFRPALNARVQVVQLAPKNVIANGVRGHVLRYAGPWKTAGEWWTATAWSREEWDVALDDGALYRIYQESTSHEWFVHGVYD